MSITIRISRDKMDAVAEVKRKQDEELDVPSIKRALEVSDVSYGVSEEDCEALVKLVNERPAGGPCEWQ